MDGASGLKLVSLKRDYPGWTITPLPDGIGFQAVSHPAQRREHVLTAETIDGLRDKLELAGDR